jgi:hypothetical protein
LGDLSAEEEETIDFDRLGKWADPAARVQAR